MMKKAIAAVVLTAAAGALTAGPASAFTVTHPVTGEVMMRMTPEDTPNLSPWNGHARSAGHSRVLSN